MLYQAGKGIIGTGRAGPANTTRDYEGALEAVTAAAAAAVRDAGLAPESLAALDAGIGLAGLNLPGELERIAGWQHPFARAYFSTDVEIACLGAHGGEDGAVIIAGTGSSGCVRQSGSVRFIGGSGFPAGDFGSGASLGLQAIQAVLLAADALGPATALTPCTEAHCGASGIALAACFAGAPAGRYAELAPLVFDAAHKGDAVATGIVRHAAAYIAAMARNLLESEPPRLSIIGGIAAPISEWLDVDVRRRLAPPLELPATGAGLLALRAGR